MPNFVSIIKTTVTVGFSAYALFSVGKFYLNYQIDVFGQRVALLGSRLADRGFTKQELESYIDKIVKQDPEIRKSMEFMEVSHINNGSSMAEIFSSLLDSAKHSKRIYFKAWEYLGQMEDVMEHQMAMEINNQLPLPTDKSWYFRICKRRGYKNLLIKQEHIEEEQIEGAIQSL